MQWTNHLDCLFAHRNGGFQPEMTELKLEGQSGVGALKTSCNGQTTLTACLLTGMVGSSRR